MNINVTRSRRNYSLVRSESRGNGYGVGRSAAYHEMNVGVGFSYHFPYHVGCLVGKFIFGIAVSVLHIGIHKSLHYLRMSAKAVVTSEINHFFLPCSAVRRNPFP